MKTLDLKQMEKICGGDHCSAASRLKWYTFTAVGLALYLYEAAMCELNPGGVTFE